jgi:hypothetical protein
MTHRHAAAAACGAGLLLLYFCDPAATAWFPSCPFRALTGYECPGCGTLRAMHQLLHGHVLAAWHLNAGAVAGLSACACLEAVDLARGRTTHVLRRLSPAITVVLAMIAIAFGIARNIPSAPLVWLFR